AERLARRAHRVARAGRAVDEPVVAPRDLRPRGPDHGPADPARASRPGVVQRPPRHPAPSAPAPGRGARRAGGLVGDPFGGAMAKKIPPRPGGSPPRPGARPRPGAPARPP